MLLFPLFTLDDVRNGPYSARIARLHADSSSPIFQIFQSYHIMVLIYRLCFFFFFLFRVSLEILIYPSVHKLITSFYEHCTSVYHVFVGTINNDDQKYRCSFSHAVSKWITIIMQLLKNNETITRWDTLKWKNNEERENYGYQIFFLFSLWYSNLKLPIRSLLRLKENFLKKVRPTRDRTQRN